MIKSRYIIVAHYWFQESKGWEIIESDATTYKEAYAEACIFQHENDCQFRKCGTKVIEIQEGEHLPLPPPKPPKPRKLHWTERLFGRINTKYNTKEENV